MNVEIVVLVIAGLWLLGLTAAFFLQVKFFNRLTKGTKKAELNKLLEKILSVQEGNDKAIKSLEKELERIEKEGQLHVQKVGLIRFNPFKEIGGDHSFSVAILDAKDTGIIVTGLHTRDRTRVYAKNVVNGKSEIELSTEEKKALESARKS